MAYVSCSYAPYDETNMKVVTRGVDAPVICIDETGREWFLSEDSEVGDWLRFKEEGGTVRETEGE